LATSAGGHLLEAKLALEPICSPLSSPVFGAQTSRTMRVLLRGASRRTKRLHKLFWDEDVLKKQGSLVTPFLHESRQALMQKIAAERGEYHCAT
jgi:hypothetical protein